MDISTYPRGYIRPPYIQISLRTALDMRDRNFGQKLTGILWTSEPRYSPTRLGLNFEKEVSCEANEEFLNNWCVIKAKNYNGTDYKFPKKLWWKNKSSLKCDGSFMHKFTATTGVEVHGSLMVTFAYRDRIDWKEMFLSLCELMQPQLAMMHVFTAENCPPEKREANFQTGNFSGLSNPKIPGLGWMFVAGEAFYKPISDFDLQGLEIDRKDYGSYSVLEIAKGAKEIIGDLQKFESRRDRLLEIFPLPIVKRYNSLLDPL